MRKSSVSKQSKHSSCSAAVIGRGSESPPRESLVPARDEGCAVGDALRGCQRLRGHQIVGDDAGDQTLFLRFSGAEDAAFEQDFQRNIRTGEANERRHFRISHHQAEVS